MRQWPQRPLWVSRLIYGPLNSERWKISGEFQQVHDDGTPIFSFRAECAWPVRFRSGDDFLVFVERMSAVAARSPVHPVNATMLRAEGMDVEEFLRRGDRSLQEIALTTNAPMVSNVYVKFKHGSKGSEPAVLVQGTQASSYTNGDMNWQSLIQEIDERTFPVTRLQRRRPFVVAPRSTLADFDRSAADWRIRWQSWLGGGVFGLVFGFLGAMLKTWAHL